MLTNDIIVIIAATEADLLARYRALGHPMQFNRALLFPSFSFSSSFSFLILFSLFFLPSLWSLRPCA